MMNMCNAHSRAIVSRKKNNKQYYGKYDKIKKKESHIAIDEDLNSGERERRETQDKRM